MLSSFAGVGVSILAGVAMGLQFHLVAAAVSATVAAALSGHRRAPRGRFWWSSAVIVAGWAVGDGIRLAGAKAAPAYLTAWAVTGLAFGYALPALAGAYVGRQVHRGTGWLAAGAVALMLVPALSVLGGALSARLWGVVP
jgi:hypothetical protein